MPGIPRPGAGRAADRQPEAPGTAGPGPGPLPAADGPLPARVREPRRSPGQGRPGPPQSPRRPRRFPAQGQHPPGPRSCLRSWCQTLRVLPGAVGRETGTPAR